MAEIGPLDFKCLRGAEDEGSHVKFYVSAAPFYILTMQLLGTGHRRGEFEMN